MGERDGGIAAPPSLTSTVIPPRIGRGTLPRKGSGWEQFLQFGNSLLQDKIMTGLSRYLFGASFEELITEYRNLPLKESVIEKWLYGNAARFFRLA